MSRQIMAGGDDPVRELLRDAFLLLGAIGASLTLVMLLSLLLPGEPQQRQQRAVTPAQPVAEHQVVASAERKVPAWRAATQQ